MLARRHASPHKPGSHTDEQKHRPTAQASFSRSPLRPADVSWLGNAGAPPLAPNALLLMQQVAGNAAVARQMARAQGPAPIQRIWPWDKSKKEEKERQRLQVIKNQQAGGNVTANDVASGGSLAEDIAGGTTQGIGIVGSTIDTTGTTLTKFGGEPSMAKVEGGKVSFTDKDTQAEMTAAGTMGWGIASLGGGASGTIDAVMGVYKAVKAVKDKNPGWGWDVAGSVLKALRGGVAGFFGVSSGLAYGVSSAAQIAAQEGAEGAGVVGNIASGIANACSGIGDLIGGVLGLAKGVMGTFKYLSSVGTKGWGQGGALVDVGLDLLSTLKGFISAGRSLVWATETFLKLANTGAEFIQAVPLVGSLANIAIQLLDALVTTIDVVRQVVRLVKGKLNARKMKALAERSVGAVKDFALEMVTINKKRWKRTIVPLVADGISLVGNVISIGGSVLNIVGAATAAAYGAGVAIMAAGYGASAGAAMLKVGAAGLRTGQKAVRWTKQKVRDAGKGGTSEPGGNTIYKVGKKLGINMDKTTEKKDEVVASHVAGLLSFISKLQDPLPPDTTPVAKKLALEEYVDARMMIKASGASLKELSNARDGNHVVKLLAEAMKKRE